MTASEKSWLFDVRSVSGQIGKLAVNDMSRRIERWRARKEKASMGSGGSSSVASMGRVGGAVESVYNERYDCK